MRVVSIVNQKGGTGKTTTAVNLAAALAENGRRVLLLDLDPQGSTTSWYSIREAEQGLYAILVNGESLLRHTQKTETPSVEVIPSSTWLVGAEKALAAEVGAEILLRRHLAQVPPNQWDYILMDCPPTLGVLTVNALTAAAEVLVPVEAHVLALSGLALLLRTVQAVQERLNESLRISGIVACRVDSRTRHALEVVEQLRQRFGELVFRTVIRENIRLAEAPSFGLPITTYSPRSYGAQDYRALAEEVIAQEQKES